LTGVGGSERQSRLICLEGKAPIGTASVLARFLPQEEAEVKEDGNEDLKHVERMKSIAFQHLSIIGSRLNRMHTDA